MSIKFKPLKEKEKVYFMVEHETCSNLAALHHGLSKVETLKLPFELGITVQTETGFNIVNNEKTFPCKYLKDAKDFTYVLNADSNKVDKWTLEDNAQDFEMQKTKLAHVDEAHLKLPDFNYSGYMIILRHLAEVFKFGWGERPADIFEEVKSPYLFNGSSLTKKANEFIYSNNLENGFILLDKSFTKEKDSIEGVPIVWLPTLNESVKLKDTYIYLGLMISNRCLAVGISDFGFLHQAIAVHKLHKNVIFSYERNFAIDTKDYHVSCQGLPGTINDVVSICSEYPEQAYKEIMFFLKEYIKTNKERLKLNQKMELIYRPLMEDN